MKSKSVCRFCDIKFDVWPSQSKGIYCSNRCQFDWRFANIIIPKYLDGKMANKTTLVKCLKAEREYKCESCGNTGFHNGKPLTLQMDHIDGNSDNNLPENLRWQCPNCHTQTTTWCGRNKKFSNRSLRMKAYRTSVGEVVIT